ncbi:TRAP transporter substrate-binding protein [Salidesulfovibrio onnuriiensis]|uniref:TRAP transporter substrate-binding protein n=1 Tax=Salidesulfovibrio onnuriiensis TaxID=2583823 RepID=UPI0011C7A1C4|nr:TRAP transporter substrate-binding protein [Salidesulfovibrio onnuriiensis]
MKRCMMLMVLLGVVCTAMPAMAETVTLRYSNFFPPTHVQSKLAEEWCREVVKRTNGEVQIEYYPGGTLTKAQQCFDGVEQGMSDIGLSALAYSRGRFPVMAAVDLPLGYKSGAAATAVANAVYEKFRPKAFRNVQVMYFHAHGPGILHTAKVPVKRLSDIKGLKLRATGNSGKLVQALGGTPVGMSMPDSYQAIQKGVVNGGMYPVETNKGWKMAEVVDYMTETYPVAYTTTFFVVMNRDKWNELSDENRRVITEINGEWAARHGQAWDESDKVGMACFLENGGTVIPLADPEAWKAAAAPMLEEYVDMANKKRLDGRAILDFTLQTLQAQ